MNKTTTSTFNLGITMAGAVSAGAYTAGFMDYLFEILELWEVQKKTIRDKINNKQELSSYEKKIPLHDVSLSVLGGASAGGMVSMITALSTFSKIQPVKKPSDVKTGNILYDSWVLLSDDDKVNTFEKMLHTDDFDTSEEGIPSLLNSKPIEVLANKVFQNLPNKNEKANRPNYISEDLRIVLTLCSLRPIPFEFNFGHITSANFPYTPGHRMNEHMLVAHFKMKYDDTVDKDVYLKFDPYDNKSKELLKLCTLATGAFPIGLAPRHFKGKLSKGYIKNSILRNLEIDPKKKSVVDIKIKGKYFDFTSIDGGTINNEPYSEVVQVLESLNHSYDPEKPMFGTIMIDPFPNFYNQDEAKPTQNLFSTSLFQMNFWDVIPKAYDIFREQVRVKHSGAFYKDYLRFLVFPLKWEKQGVLKNHPPISCASLGGFGGFLDVEFRKHDFFLGRNNARNFFRAFFMLEYDTNNLHPLFNGLTKESIKVFKKGTKAKKNGSEKIFFPIIPDLNLIKDKETKNTNPFHNTYPNFPILKKGYLKRIEPLLKKRVRKILVYQINDKLKNEWFERSILLLFKGLITKRITKKVIEIMTRDYTNRKMFKE